MAEYRDAIEGMDRFYPPQADPFAGRDPQRDLIDRLVANYEANPPQQPPWWQRLYGGAARAAQENKQLLSMLPGYLARGAWEQLQVPYKAYTGELTGDELVDAGIGMGLSAAGSSPVASAPAGALAAGAARRVKPPPGGGKFPQYAEQYPPVPPPVEAFDKVSKKPYLAKGTSPEIELFGQERQRIQREIIDKGNYEPMFPVEQRYDVDPSNYPRPIDTRREAVPAKQATIEKNIAEHGLSEAATLERLRAAYERGREIPGAENWYHMGQLEKAFIDQFGPELGRQLFEQRFARSMAATTGGASPKDNFIMSQFGNYLQQQGMPYPKEAYAMPYPVGGRFVSGNLAQHQRAMESGVPFDIGNPKRSNFEANFLGHADRATMDEVMSNLIKPGQNSPPRGQYGLWEDLAHTEAARAGVDPRYYQEVAWAGGKKLKQEAGKAGKQAVTEAGRPMIQEINEAIERTHQLTGMSREEILRRGILGGEIPIYGMGAGVPWPTPQQQR